MAKRTILKFIFGIFSLPYLLTSDILYHFNILNFRTIYIKIYHLALNSQEISNVCLSILKIAEDHRNELHSGVDPLAVVRCLYVKIFKDKTEGGSTIEQQFVRVVTGYKSKNIFRKIIEQIFSVRLCKYVDKKKIASAYLCIAYYGFDNLKFYKFINNFCEDYRINDYILLYVISCLKYPEPKYITDEWIEKISNRISYIKNRAAKYDSNLLNQLEKKIFLAGLFDFPNQSEHS